MIHTLEIQGHRGNRGHIPENTLPAFQSALEGGIEVLELDLGVTQDGEIVIHHNFALNPLICSNQDGSKIEPILLHQLSLAAIKTIDCGHTHPDFPLQNPCPNAQIPTLQELFDLIRTSSHPNALKVRLNLEIKRDHRHPEWTLSPKDWAKKVTALVSKNHFQSRVYYSSFDQQVLEEIRNIAPDAPLLFDYWEETIQEAGSLDSILAWAQAHHIASLGPDETLFKTKEDVLSLQRQGFRVIPWTVNEEKRWKELIEMGVDGIITDYPLELKRSIEEN